MIAHSQIPLSVADESCTMTSFEGKISVFANRFFISGRKHKFHRVTQSRDPFQLTLEQMKQKQKFVCFRSEKFFFLTRKSFLLLYILVNYCRNFLLNKRSLTTEMEEFIRAARPCLKVDRKLQEYHYQDFSLQKENVYFLFSDINLGNKKYPSSVNWKQFQSCICVHATNCPFPN